MRNRPRIPLTAALAFVGAAGCAELPSEADSRPGVMAREASDAPSMDTVDLDLGFIVDAIAEACGSVQYCAIGNDYCPPPDKPPADKPPEEPPPDDKPPTSGATGELPVEPAPVEPITPEES